MKDYLNSGIDKIKSKHSYAGIFIAGDFNHFPDRFLTNGQNMKQIVDKNTRQNKILDKCYPNCGEFYYQIKFLPNLGKSGHLALLCKPNQNAKYDKGQQCTKQTRVSGNKKKVTVCEKFERNKLDRPLLFEFLRRAISRF